MKRVLALVAILLLLVSAVAVTSAADFPAKGK
jgi:hypothetical protein